MRVMKKLPISHLLKKRRFWGYGAAIAVMPYLLIKIAWTFGLFMPTEQMGEPSWRTANAVTMVLAAVGILLALAFSMTWGERLPAWLVALPVWVGTGLLIPMLLLAPVLGPAAMIRDQQAGAANVWVYEQIFVMVSLVGVSICLPFALVEYAKARWPEAFADSIDIELLPGNSQKLQITLARLVAAGCILLGFIKLFWAVGGTIGINPAMLDKRDLWWHLLSLSTGVWAFAGAWGLLVLTTRRRSKRFFPPMAAAWISSGMLFSYNLFNRLSATRPDAQPTIEYPFAYVLATELGSILGVMMGIIILMVLHDRQRAMRSSRMN
ncbi:hypothetical protein E2K98_30090 [Bacillus salipaludis]|uniref:Uncharacterized protein n=1 Tax=Bacillus salipaludis TaxID=2547811 RepID=A0A4R5VHC9_9BACI|nr:hypothetical protein [Bacillus salipaludis]MDQ6598957.1 hypothetical protein [Bacillus salipaludis]TDK53716.1 hypothetical protein E2K98_30090 [Bacillus salipaludis]